MQLNIVDIDNVYNSKTREYVQEVITSYAIGNYRSAIVMLYSTAVCDIIYKLQELKDMYNDTVATEILKEVEATRTNLASKSKSKWEWDLIEKIYHKTNLLDDESYNNLEILYRYRNFSAHPAMNDSFELIAPSQEMTIALIKNTYRDILAKPPIFIKSIVETLTEDLKTKNEIYRDSYNELKRYLNNKYFDRMTNSMKLSTLKAFWKFCFNMPDDENCKNNLAINRKALLVLIEGFEREAVNHIKDNNSNYSVATDKKCINNLIILLSECPTIYDVLNDDVKIHIEKQVESNIELKVLCWFKFKNLDDYLKYVESDNCFDTIKNVDLVARVVKHFEYHGEESSLLDCFIETYGKSCRFDDANENYKVLIAPYLGKMNKKHFERLIVVSNENSQIYERRSSKYANDEILKYGLKLLPEDFDFDEYPNFAHSEISEAEDTDDPTNNTHEQDKEPLFDD